MSRHFPKILASALVYVLALSSSGQTRKRSTTAKKPPIDRAQPIDSRCGVHYDSINEFARELDQEWRLIGSTKDGQSYFYNTRKMVCDKHGILKVWLKTVHIGKADGSSLDHWEVNCKTSQWRLTSFVNYDKDGRVTNSDEHVVVEWQDAIPDSVGEKELNTVCRKKP